MAESSRPTTGPARTRLHASAGLLLLGLVALATACDPIAERLSDVVRPGEEPEVSTAADPEGEDASEVEVLAEPFDEPGPNPFSATSPSPSPSPEPAPAPDCTELARMDLMDSLACEDWCVANGCHFDEYWSDGGGFDEPWCSCR